MKIGHYMPGICTPGGISSYIRRLSQAQRQLGHDVMLLDRGESDSREPDLYTTRDDDDLTAKAESLGLDVLHLHSHLQDSSRLRIPAVRTMHGHWAYCPSGSRYLARPGVACDRAYSFAGCTWGHVVDRCGSVRPARFAHDFRRTWTEMRQPPDIPVLAVSEFVRQQMIRSGYPGETIRALHLPAPEAGELVAPSPDRPVRLLFMGRLVVQKGIEPLVRAMARLGNDIRLDVAGDGPELPRMRELVNRLGIESRITFHGWIEETRVFELAAACGVIVFPSVWHEPAGLVTLEAAALGRAVVATRVGGIPEYAEKLGNTLLVEPNNPSALSEAISRLIADRALRDQLAAAGYAQAKSRFNVDQHVAELHSVYAAAQSAKR
jgi:glycosyltransferase involved in cell wall biosynthesis